MRCVLVLLRLLEVRRQSHLVLRFDYILDRVTELCLLAKSVVLRKIWLPDLKARVNDDLARLRVRQFPVLLHVRGSACVSSIDVGMHVRSERVVSRRSTGCNDAACILDVRDGIGTNLLGVGGH